jgi:WD40 repeat protein
MEGTRQSILNEITTWVTNQPGSSNTYWIYGLPGIGKTSLAHSICETLHERNQLIGAFFCQRDDTNSSEPRNILPTLLYKLAENSPTFRGIVAERLRSNPNLTSESMKATHFLDFFLSLPGHPNGHSCAFVIDALDECGNYQSRQDVLKALTDATALAPWFKIIITSRPEADIERFFRGITGSSYSSYDLATDRKASDDLGTFARSQFDLVASNWGLPKSWPEESDFNRVISRANGLFIFIKTLVLALEKCEDAEESLKEALQGSAGTGLESLYGLYSSILKAHSNISGFWRMIVVITTAQYRPLCKEPIAKLTGVKPNLVGKWVNALSSLLYRDEGANGAVRVRHLSISDFFLSDRCEYQANLREAHTQQGIACLEMMIKELRFNICKLDDSRVANTDVKDLQSRIEENISDSLQYSSLYWSNHICFSPDSLNRDPRALGNLKGFFEGPYTLFWIEVLSIMRMVPMGAPSLRRVITSVRVSTGHLCARQSHSDSLKDADSTLLGKIQDVCRFIITFHTPLSISAPHAYISTRPFLPSQSHLSTIFCTTFTKGIEMKGGKLASWPAPPLEWIGHTNGVLCMRYSPNGSHIVTGSIDSTIRIWDAETGTTVGEPLKGHTGWVWGVAYSPNGRHIISGCYDGTIRIWDAETGAAIGKPIEAHEKPVWSVAFSPNGRHIISGSDDGTIQIWDVEKSAAVGKPLEGHIKSVLSVAYSPDGQNIVSGSKDLSVRIWDSETGGMVGNPLEGHRASVRSVIYSPDGRHIVSGSDDNTIRIWDAHTGAAVGKPLEGHGGGVNSVAYSPNGRQIISGSDDYTIKIWDAATGIAVGEPLRGQLSRVWSVAYSPDGRYTISGYDDGIIRIWDAVTGDAVGKPLEAHRNRVSSVAYSPDGRHITSGCDDMTIRIWDADTGAAVGNSLKGGLGKVNSVARSPDGQYIISGSSDGAIRIWDAATGATVGEPLNVHRGAVRSVAYSPDGRYIISGYNNRTIQIWDAKTGAQVGKPLEGHTSIVFSVAYSPDGRHIISGSTDRSLRIWDSKTGAVVGKPLQGHIASVRSVTYSPDGRHIVSGSGDETIRIWDAGTGDVVGDPLKGHTSIVNSVAYSPDGQHIISGSSDKTIRIWDALTGVAVWEPLVGHVGPVWSVACSPDGRHIISGSDDMTIRIWDAKTGTAISNPSEGHTRTMNSIAGSLDSQHIDSASGGDITHVPDLSTHVSIPFSSSSDPIHPMFGLLPDTNGWVTDPEGGLLYWVPPDCRRGLHSPALLTIPVTSKVRSVYLDFTDSAFGTSWTQVFRCAQP